MQPRVITESVTNFLRRGQLTNFPFGTNRETVITMLGHTTWTAERPVVNETVILKYDKTELYFGGERVDELCAVQITYSLRAPKHQLVMDYGELNQPLNYDQTKDFLKSNEITFQEIMYGETRVIKTEGQILLYFLDDNKLLKFGRFL